MSISNNSSFLVHSKNLFLRSLIVNGLFKPPFTSLIISSKFVKEIAYLGGNIERFVTKYTVKMLKNKYL